MKGKIMELLRTGDMQGLDALIEARPVAVRHVLGRLWDVDSVVRERAAVAVGSAAAHHQELGLELMRRFVWALNDESATNGVDVIPAMAAIAIRVPEMAKPFVGQLVGALHDPSLSQEAKRALEAIRRERPDLVEPYEGEIDCVRDNNCRTRGRDCPSSPEQGIQEETWSKN
ncbi:MAG: hypothetical protein DRJ61_18685 [Acidobacteria bacterium]|nr:MAG: hypothetical protein DRJ61_18685 [Acidobacteriota bacterium]